MIAQNLVNTLKNDYSISNCTLNDLEKCVFKKYVPKNVIIQNELEIAENIFFIESGISFNDFSSIPLVIIESNFLLSSVLITSPLYSVFSKIIF